MPAIERSDAKECVRRALQSIAGIGNDIEGYSFTHWHDFHKKVFINAVALCISQKGSRIVLNEGMLGNQGNQTIGNFIDYVYNNAAFLGEPEPPLQDQGGDLKP